MIKILSVFLSFTILFSSIAPSYAQALYDAKKQQSRYAFTTDWSNVASGKWEQYGNQLTQSMEEGVEQALQQASAQKAEDLQLMKAAQKAKEEYGTDYIAQTAANIWQAAQKEKEEICLGKECFNLVTLARGVFHAGLSEVWNGQKVEEISAWNYGMDKKGQTRPLAQLVQMAGVWEKDRKAASNYFKGVLQVKGVCEKGFDIKPSSQDAVDYSRYDEPRCEAALESMAALAVLGGSSNAEAIYNFMNDKKREAMGGAVVMQGVTALMGMNTQESYNYLTRFLTKDSTPTYAGTALDEIGYATVEGVISLFQENGKDVAGRYLNSYTARFGYLDETEAKKQQPKADLWIIKQQVDLFGGSKDKWQLPVGNIYEDVGNMIAADVKNARSRDLAKQIFAASQDSKLGRFPFPLLTGLLTGNKGVWTYQYGGKEAIAALKRLQKVDFTDLNEGSQRRLRRRAALAEQAHEAFTPVKVPSSVFDKQREMMANLRGYSLAPEYTQDTRVSRYDNRDQAKFDRYNNQKTARALGRSVDIMILLVLLPRLIQGLCNVGSRGIAALRNASKLKQPVSKASRVVAAAGKVEQPAARAAVQTTRTAVKAEKPAAQAAAQASQATANASTTPKYTLVAMEDGKTVSLVPEGVQLEPVSSVKATIAATGEASASMQRSVAEAQKAISEIKTTVASRFSAADQAAFRKTLQGKLAQASSAKRASTGSGTLTVQEKVALYQDSYSLIYQQQQEALKALELEEQARAFVEYGLKNPTSTRVIRHIPFRVRAQVAISDFNQNVWQALRGVTTNKTGAATALSLGAIGNPAFTGATTEIGAVARSLQAPIAIVADYAGGLGSKTLQLRNFVVPGLNAPRNLGQAVVSLQAPKGLAGSFVSGRIGAADVLARALFPAGVANFSGRFSQAAIADAYQADPAAAAAIFGKISADEQAAATAAAEEKAAPVAEPKHDAQFFSQTLDEHDEVALDKLLEEDEFVALVSTKLAQEKTKALQGRHWFSGWVLKQELLSLWRNTTAASGNMLLASGETFSEQNVYTAFLTALQKQLQSNKVLSNEAKDIIWATVKAEAPAGLLTVYTSTAAVPRAARKYLNEGKTADIVYERVSLPSVDGLKNYVLARKYHFIRTESHYSSNQEIPANATKEEQKKILEAKEEEIKVAREKSDLIAARVLEAEKLPKREALLWILASASSESKKLHAYATMVKLGYKLPTEKEVIEFYNASFGRTVTMKPFSNIERAELQLKGQLAVRENLSRLEMIPADERVLSYTYDDEDLLQISEKKLNSVLYLRDEINPAIHILSEKTVHGNTRYLNYLPAYLRLQNGSLSSEPRILLPLWQKSTIGRILSLGRKGGFVVPRGFVVALDESGKWKLVANRRREFISSSHFKNMIASITPGHPLRKWKGSPEKRILPIETNLRTTEAQALFRQLLKNKEFMAIPIPAPKDQFSKMINEIALVAGSDTGASLSSQFKKSFPITELGILISGLGYLSPLVFNMFKGIITKYGNFRAIRAVLLAILGASALGLACGMTGTYVLPEMGVGALVPLTFFLVMISGASILSSLASPVLKNVYQDKVVFGVKNLFFTTLKGFSRMAVAAITAAFDFLNRTGIPWVLAFRVWLEKKANVPVEAQFNWSIVVGFAAGLAGLALWHLYHSRLHTEYKAAKKLEKEQNANHKQTLQEKRAEKTKKKESKRFFKEFFAPQMKTITTRLGMIYMAYALITSVEIGLMGGVLFSPGLALFVTFMGYGLNFGVRMLSNWLLKKRIFTDDQLTGFFLPLMSLGIISAFLAPYSASSPAMLLASWALIQASTATFGVAENTRMMNIVSSYYKKARAAVRQNEDLTTKEREKQLMNLKKEEEMQKNQAAAKYNFFNFLGLLPILFTLGLVALLRVDGVAEFINQISPWMSQSVEISQKVLESEGEAVAMAKMNSDIALLQMLRYATIPSVILSILLCLKNLGMEKDGWKRIFTLGRRLKEKDILKDDATIIKQLNMSDFTSNLQHTKEELAETADKLLDQARGYSHSLTSEGKIATLLKDVIHLNNSMKVFVDNVPQGEKLLADELLKLRMIGYNLDMLLNGNKIRAEHIHVRGNDVSSVLRADAEKFISSVKGLRFAHDGPTKAFVEQLAQIREMFPYDDSLHNLTYQLEEFLFNRDDETCAKIIATLKKRLTLAAKRETNDARKEAINQLNDEMYAQGQERLEQIQQGNPEVLAKDLQYVAEKKRFAKVKYYERALDYENEMDKIAAEYNAGEIYDNILDDYKLYYNLTLSSLEQYMQANRNTFGATEENRVRSFRQRVQKKYQDFMHGTDEAGTATKSAGKSSAY